MSRDQVLAAIPHRDPFLWVDEIVEQTADSIHTRKFVSPDLDVFRGHYPEFPITPGVLVCEAIFQTGAILLAGRAKAAMAEGKLPVMTRIQDTRFRTMVRPGDTLEITVDLEDEIEGKLFHMKGVAKVGGKKAVTTRFACALANKPEEA